MLGSCVVAKCFSLGPTMFFTWSPTCILLGPQNGSYLVLAMRSQKWFLLASGMALTGFDYLLFGSCLVLEWFLLILTICFWFFNDNQVFLDSEKGIPSKSKNNFRTAEVEIDMFSLNSLKSTSCSLKSATRQMPPLVGIKEVSKEIHLIKG